MLEQTDGRTDTLPTKALVKDLLQETQHLVREEVHLAKLELREEAKRVGKGAGAMGAAGVMGHVALLCFAACIGLLLATAMAGWVAALLTTLLFGAIAGGLFFWGRKNVQNLKPERTVKTLEEDREWMKDTLQRVKSRSHASA
jgi:uncharacterized membrane protein YqjE